jgi:hypothetical protein
MQETDLPWRDRNQDSFALLETITATDKALAVPYIKIWQVTNAGKPVHPDPNNKNAPDPSKSITNLLIQPPTFGSSVDRFSERAPVALERVVVKRALTKTGAILHRFITLTFTVFQPERVFDESNEDFDEWWALVRPGTYFILRYGWTGQSSNDLLNGNGIVDKNNFVEGQHDVLFQTTTWNFSINPDGSLSFVIQAIDSGDNILAQVHLSDLDYFSSPAPQGQENSTSYTVGTKNTIKETRSPDGQAIIKKLQNTIHDLYNPSGGGQGTPGGKGGRAVPFSEILNKVFAPLMTSAVKAVGYDDVQLFLGMFNHDIGAARKDCGGVMQGKSIGDFLVPESWFKDLLGFKRASGQQLNLMAVFKNLLNYIQRQENWAGAGLTDAEKQQAEKAATENGQVNKKLQATEEARILRKRQSPPELMVKTATTRDKGKLVYSLYIYDMKQLSASIDFDDRLDPSVKVDEIHKKLKKYNIPLVSFKNGLSYIQEANFSMEQDANMQHIAIERAVDPNRYQTVGVTHAAQAADGIDPRKLFLSSNITGRITMIGNFVWDTFLRIWLEFGVKRWDGPFHMMEREDTIDASNFITTVSVRATGTDPLNTQGVLKDTQHRNTNPV